MRRAQPLLVITAAAVAVAVVGFGAVTYQTGFFGFYGCTSSERDFGDRLAEEPALMMLSDRYSTHEAPQHGCDDDDRTVSVDAEFATGEREREALREGASILEDAGWTASSQRPWCFDKQIDGRDVMAELEYLSEFRTHEDTDLLISLVDRMPGGCRHD